MTYTEFIQAEVTYLSPLPTYHDQEIVQRTEMWRREVLWALGGIAVGLSFSDMYAQRGAHLQQSIESDIDRMTLLVGGQLAGMLSRSPFVDQIEQVTGRGKGLVSLAAKRQRRMAQGSTKPFSDICAYAVDVPNGSDTRALLEHMRTAYGVEQTDAYGDPIIDVMGNDASDRTFRKLNILVGKFHTSINGRRYPFELMVRTSAQREGYICSREGYEDNRPVDKDIAPAIGLIAFRASQPVVFYAKPQSGS
jgi:hypothetical protein